jgi:hypothetical protein
MNNLNLTRRRFLQGTAALASGAFLPLGFAQQQPRPELVDALDAYTPKDGMNSVRRAVETCDVQI